MNVWEHADEEKGLFQIPVLKEQLSPFPHFTDCSCSPESLNSYPDWKFSLFFLAPPDQWYGTFTTHTNGSYYDI
jgi:hypothetical protein